MNFDTPGDTISMPRPPTNGFNLADGLMNNTNSRVISDPGARTSVGALQAMIETEQASHDEFTLRFDPLAPAAVPI
jgi:hypothetical protein